MSVLLMVPLPASRAMPKSDTFTCPSAWIRMFWGLISRWMMPFLCMCCSAESRRMAICTDVVGGSAPFSSMISFRVRPSTYSSTR